MPANNVHARRETNQRIQHFSPNPVAFNARTTATTISARSRSLTKQIHGIKFSSKRIRRHRRRRHHKEIGGGQGEAGAAVRGGDPPPLRRRQESLPLAA